MYHSSEMLKIAVQILIRDNRKYLVDYFFPYFADLEKKLEHEVKISYFFLENDSCDESHKVIEKFIKSRSGLLITSAEGKVGTPKQATADTQHEAAGKMHKLASLRTKINRLVPHEEYDYVFVLDSDIRYRTCVFENFVKILENEENVGMVTANGVIRDGVWRGLYYDTWACEFLGGGTPHGHSRSIDAFPSGCVSKMIKNVYGFMIPVNHPCRVRVNAAFGGSVMVRSRFMKDFVYKADGVFNFTNVGKVKTRGAMCEHKSLCRRVIDEGFDVIIDPASVCTWSRDPVVPDSEYLTGENELPPRPETLVGSL